MLIHSVTPLDFLLEQPEYPRLVTKSFPGGVIEGEETARGFVISRLHSTDPAMYLSRRYEPGAVCALRIQPSERNERI